MTTHDLGLASSVIVEPNAPEGARVDQASYWEEYYSERRADHALIPSQFAAFFAAEVVGRIDGILDVGCGNGRDTLFFSGLGHYVVGLDSSSEAIGLCRSRASLLPEPERQRLRFVNTVATGPGIASGLQQLQQLGAERIAVYGRFFLHAVDESVEAELLRSAMHAGFAVVVLAFEFRTPRDRELAKSTPDHYRRFIEPAALIERAASFGYTVEYSTEGFGLAKFRTEDAHVSRVILTPSRR